MWHQGEDYSRDIIEMIRNGATSWIDWNLALDMSGGPNWAGNHRNAAIIVDSKKDVFYKAPSFYHLFHFSRFLIRGSQIINSSYKSAVFALRPDGYKVGVILNDGLILKKFSIEDNSRFLNIKIKPRSILTILWK